MRKQAIGYRCITPITNKVCDSVGCTKRASHVVILRYDIEGRKHSTIEGRCLDHFDNPYIGAKTDTSQG